MTGATVCSDDWVGPVTSSLDNCTGLVTDPAVKGVKYRAPVLPPWHGRTIATQRQIDRWLRASGQDGRLTFCGLPVRETVGLVLQRRASWVGIAKCDSWDCPRCARGKAGRAARRLAACMAAAKAAGWTPWFLTLTMAHGTGDSLERCVRAAREGWRQTRRKLTAHPDVRGHVVAWEVTLGRSGWHLHAHVLVFTAGDMGGCWALYSPARDGERAGYGELLTRERRKLVDQIDALSRGHETNTQRMRALRERARCQRDLWTMEGDLSRYVYHELRAFHRQIATAWCAGVARTGMDRPAPWRQHLERAKDDDEGIVNYMVKTAYEVTGGATKRGRRGSWTPRGILELSSTGHLQAWSAWREYRDAMHGLHRIAGIPHLEKQLVITADVQLPRPAIIGAISAPTYAALRSDSLDQPIIKMVDVGCVVEGAWSVRDWLGTMGEFETVADLRLSAARHWAGGCMMLHALALDLIRVGDVHGHRLDIDHPGGREDPRHDVMDSGSLARICGEGWHVVNKQAGLRDVAIA